MNKQAWIGMIPHEGAKLQFICESYHIIGICFSTKCAKTRYGMARLLGQNGIPCNRNQTVSLKIVALSY